MQISWFVCNQFLLALSLLCHVMECVVAHFAVNRTLNDESNLSGMPNCMVDTTFAYHLYQQMQNAITLPQKLLDF